MQSTIILLAIIVVAVLGKANSVAVSACILLVVKLINIDRYIFPTVEKDGIFWGLVLIVAAILIPIAKGDITLINVKNIFTSWVGILALLLSFLTTYLSGLGLQYLTLEGHSNIMPAMILGAVAAAAFLGGVPVGPLITSGILSLIVRLFPKH